MSLFDGCILSSLMGLLAYHLTQQLLFSPLTQLFFTAGLFGSDINKKEKPRIPEAMGLVGATVFLMIACCFLPVPFIQCTWLGHSRTIFSLDKVPLHFSCKYY